MNFTQSSDRSLLTYYPSTRPQPIQVSTPDTPVTGAINTAAINMSGTGVYCNRVVIAVPVDTGGLFTASPSPSASVNTGKWAISTMASQPGHEISLTEGVDYSVFTFECKDPSDYQITYNLVFGLVGQVTDTPADFTIWIQENSGTSPDPNTFTEKTTSFTVTSYTPQFYLENFITTVPASPTSPATEFANGKDIRFSWESNGTFFEIFQKDNSTPIYSGMQTNYTLRGGVARDTTFVLVAMMTGNPGGEKSAGEYTPIYLYDSIGVTISNPDLTPRSANISGDALVGGALKVNGPLTAGGNVGIGTSTPRFPLTFESSLGDKIALWGQSGNHFGLGIQNSLLQIYTDTAGADVAFGSGSSGSFSETMRVKGNGRLGIGTSNPLSRLHIHGDYSNSGAGGFMLDASDNNDPESYALRINPYVVGGGMVGYQFQTKSLGGGTNVPLAFDNAGNVGIGTAAPQTRLDVAGNVHIAGDVNIDGRLNIGDWTIACEHDGGWGSNRSSLHIRYQGVEIARLGPGADDLQIRAVDQNLNSHGYFYFNQDGNSGFNGQ